MIEYELRLICKHDSRTVEGCVTCEAADEIERLRARLEIDAAHPYDGIATRDETIRMQDGEIERLRAEVEALRADAKRYRWLRAELNVRDVYPLASVVWKQNCDRSSHEWTNFADAESLDSHIDEALAAWEEGQSYGSRVPHVV